MSIIKLTAIEIYAFRSIEYMKIDLDRKEPLILVGKNECGKSNIIRALRLLQGNDKFNDYDEKMMSDAEEKNIRYYCNIDEKWLKDRIKSFFDEQEIADKNYIYDKKSNIEYFTAKFKKSLFIIHSGKNLNNSYFNNEDLINEDWYQDKTGIVGKEYISKQDLLKKSINIEDALINDEIVVIKMKNIMHSIYSYLKDDIMNYKPEVIYWNYKEDSHQLPKSVSKEEFKNSPDISLPLKNMFLLAGYDESEIKKVMAKCQTSSFSKNEYKNLFKRVNKAVAEYVEKSWGHYKDEYKNVTIELSSNGDDIDISIADEQNYYEFEQRSDGFRRFVSFLLMQAVALENDKNHDKQKVILIDEPEVGLHPSSAKDLKDKLFELSENALVVYSTHSISMIDTDNVENNIIVSKKGENTEKEFATEDGVSSGESIYNAIGYSIYDELKKQNIIVEGISDKKIMQKIFKNEKSFKHIGICYARGVKGVEKITPFLDLASREYVVLSDADDMGKEYQKKFGNNDIWFTYKDLGFKYITIEDFLKNDFIKDTMQKIETLKDLSYNIEEYNKIEKLKIYLYKNKATLNINDDDDIKTAINNLKDLLSDNYEKKYLEEDKLLEVLKAITGKLTGKSDGK